MKRGYAYLLAFSLGSAVRLLSACGEDGRSACEAGELDCPCFDGVLCAAGLSCIDGVCVDEGFGTGDEGESQADAAEDDGGEGNSGPDEGETGDLPECTSSDECPETHVCVAGACGNTDLYDFQATVVVFVPPVCRDGVGNAELGYQVFQDGTLTDVSPEVGCPGAWPHDPFVYDSLNTLAIDFYEIDAFFDDFITSICWMDEASACSPVPPQVLHDGGWSGMIGDSYVELRFEALPF